MLLVLSCFFWLTCSVVYLLSSKKSRDVDTDMGLVCWPCLGYSMFHVGGMCLWTHIYVMTLLNFLGHMP